MKLYVARHGETDWNRHGIACGTGDAPLDAAGREQARSLARLIETKREELDIRHIVVSNLRRARETAEACGRVLGLNPVVDERFHEMSVGTWLGFDTRPEGPETERYHALRDEPFQRLEGGESFGDVLVRVYPALDDLRRTYAPDNVLLVCHGIVIRAVATYFRSFDWAPLLAYKTENCQLRCFDMADARVVPPSCVPVEE